MKLQAKSATISDRIERAMIAEKEDVVMVEETTDKVHQELLKSVICIKTLAEFP
jgi:hypothetical protein